MERKGRRGQRREEKEDGSLNQPFRIPAYANDLTLHRPRSEVSSSAWFVGLVGICTSRTAAFGEAHSTFINE